MVRPSMLPLLPDGPADAVLVYRAGQPVTRAEFLAEVQALAQRLPAGGWALNLCGDRSRFMVGVLACIARGVVCVLPHSNAPEHLAALAAEQPGLIALTDEDRDWVPGMPQVRVDAPSAPGAEVAGAAGWMPQIPVDQRVARLYTSGSTGRPQAIDKTFGALWHGLQAAARRIWPVMAGPGSVVGTSSFRHMFGFEATVLMPLWSGGQVSGAAPFFPADVAAALAAVPAPRLLVTTPYHLRTLLDADVAFPPVAAILSATAPLSPELAQRAESVLGAKVLEVYGSTELGMTATREPCRQSVWTTLDGITLSQPAPDQVAVSGPSWPGPQRLQDVVEPLDATRFRLIDRGANLINIVGKRSSLALLNHALLDIPGVQDGTFCQPVSEAERDSARLAAFVVAPGLRAPDILTALRQQVDPVFLPRPIVFVEHLPRDANGKLPAASLRALMDAHLS